MRLVKLKDVPIRVEGKYGVVIIEAGDKQMSVSTIPDTGCQSRIQFKHMLNGTQLHDIDQEGHKIIMEKRE